MYVGFEPTMRCGIRDYCDRSSLLMATRTGSKERRKLCRAETYSSWAAGRRPYMTRGLTPCMRKPGRALTWKEILFKMKGELSQQAARRGRYGDPSKPRQSHKREAMISTPGSGEQSVSSVVGMGFARSSLQRQTPQEERPLCGRQTHPNVGP